jgi:hypothetical protein
MTAVAAVGERSRRHRVDRLVAGLLLVMMAVGSLALWLLVPAAVLWGLGQVTTTTSRHLILGLAAVPLAMVLFGVLLAWLNMLYLRVSRTAVPLDDAEEPGRVRGPLEPLLGWSLAAAVIVALAWLILHPIPQLSAGIG